MGTIPTLIIIGVVVLIVIGIAQGSGGSRRSRRRGVNVGQAVGIGSIIARYLTRYHDEH